MKFRLLDTSRRIPLVLLMVYASITQSAEKAHNQEKEQAHGTSIKTFLKDTRQAIKGWHDLKQVTPIVHEQLRKAGCKRPESLSVVAANGYAIRQEAIFVPSRELAAILREKRCRKLNTRRDLVRLQDDMRYNQTIYSLYQEVCPKGPLNSVQDSTALKENLAKEIDYHYSASVGSLYHEAHHYQHLQKRGEFSAQACAVTATLDVTAVATCAATIGFYLFADEKTPFTHCKGLVAAATLSRVVNPFAQRAHSRQEEWAADEHIPDDPALLRAMTEKFARLDRDARARREKDIYENNQQFSFDLVNTNPIINILSPHPLHKERTMRFAERAEAAEQGKPRPALAFSVFHKYFFNS